MMLYDLVVFQFELEIIGLLLSLLDVLLDYSIALLLRTCQHLF